MINWPDADANCAGLTKVDENCPSACTAEVPNGRRAGEADVEIVSRVPPSRAVLTNSSLDVSKPPFVVVASDLPSPAPINSV